MTKRLSLWRVAIRPRWLAALALALVVASVFAALGQWQLERSIASATVIERDTETVVALSSLETPQSTITTEGSGRMVSVNCSFDASDDVMVTNRQAMDRSGSWLVRHCRSDDGYSLAVVAGWAPANGTIPSPPVKWWAVMCPPNLPNNLTCVLASAKRLRWQSC